MAEPSRAAMSLISKDGGMPPDSQRRRDTLWLVYKWEGLQPLALYPTAEQQLPVFFWAQGSDGQTRARFRMLRCEISERPLLRNLHQRLRPSPTAPVMACTVISSAYDLSLQASAEPAIVESQHGQGS